MGSITGDIVGQQFGAFPGIAAGGCASAMVNRSSCWAGARDSMIAAGIHAAGTAAYHYVESSYPQKGWGHLAESPEKRIVAGYPRPYYTDGDVHLTVDRDQRKLIFMAPDDPEYSEALSRPGIPGKVLIISHGNELTAGGLLTPQMMAPIVRESGVWQPGMDIVHDACNIAKIDRGFAYGMSQELGVAYTGPTAYSWGLWRAVGGGSIIYDTARGGNFPDFSRPGRWRTFYPDINPRDRQ